MVDTFLTRGATFVSLLVLLPWSSAAMAYNAGGKAEVRSGASPPVIDTYSTIEDTEVATSEVANERGSSTAISSSSDNAALSVSANSESAPGGQLFRGLAQGFGQNLLVVPSPTGSSETTANAAFHLRFGGDLTVNEKSPDHQEAVVTARVIVNKGFVIDLADITLEARFDGDSREVLEVSPGLFRVEKALDDKSRLSICDDPGTADSSCFVDAGFSYNTSDPQGLDMDFEFVSNINNHENNLVFDLLVPGILDLDTEITFGVQLGVETQAVSSVNCFDCPFATAFFGNGLSYALSTGSTFLNPQWSSQDTVGAPRIAPLASVPLPPAFWLFGSGLLGLVGIARRKRLEVETE